MHTDTHAHTELVTGPPQDTWPSRPVHTEAVDPHLQSSQSACLCLASVSSSYGREYLGALEKAALCMPVLSDTSPEAEVTGTPLWAASGTTAPCIHPSTHRK